jgi:hypothetical protein
LHSIKRKLKKQGMADAFEPLLEEAGTARWVVFSEASMAGAKHVMHYLGQYTQRVAISNQRVINITGNHVTFIAKDYRDKARKKPVHLDGIEFLRRFCMHIMPEGFVRIRRYGIYNHTTIRNNGLQFIPMQQEVARKIENAGETTTERIKRLTGFDVGKCPSCKTGKMVKFAQIPRNRSPTGLLPTLFNSKLK